MCLMVRVQRLFDDFPELPVEPEVLARVPRGLALGHDVLSVASDNNHLTVAIPDVTDTDLIDRVRLATGMHVHAVMAPREAIRQRLALAYGLPDEAPAIRELDAIHRRALKYGASDVHIEPTLAGGRVRERVDGVLREVSRVGPELYAPLVSRIKVLAGIDIAERRQPQDGRYSLDDATGSADVRVSSVPTMSGEKLVLRFLNQHAAIPRLEHLGMNSRLLARYRSVVTAAHGFIVACGPTGSGKTTTLYASLAERNVSAQNLCSVEDPVEIRLAGVSQVQINARAGVTFAAAVRSFLRQDPNVIMIGELRDGETATVGIAAALAGQLVLTTLHSTDAARTFERLDELGVARSSLAASLSAVLGQRLVRSLCVGCREVAQGGYRADGCEQCDGTGFRGRRAMFELLVVDDAIREAIARGDSGARIALLACAAGYEPLRSEGARLVREGKTSPAELQRVLGSS